MDSLLKRTAAWFKLLGIDGFDPVLSKSKRWIEWVTTFTPNTCMDCAQQHGKIFDRNDPPEEEPPLHPNCHCYLRILLAILAGTATFDGLQGADYTIKQYGRLPDNYVTQETADAKGWRSKKGNLREILENATIGGDIYQNKNVKLPQMNGRIWYEADINYTGGYRNRQRLLYSNDGLMFVTYDHYETFYEII